MKKKEGRDRRKEKQQWESESRTWVVKDEMLLEHFISEERPIYMLFFFFFSILGANISYSLLFPFSFLSYFFLKLSFISGVFFVATN